MFFDSWSALGRIAILGSLGYLSLILLLRITGKRTLSKMNAFDFIVTVALGSCLAGIMLNKSLSLADGVTALATLIFLQFIIATLAAHFKPFNHLIKSEPTLVLHNGEFLHGVMRKERLTEEDIRGAVRSSGFANTDEIRSVILETEGTLSVIPKGERKGSGALEDVADQMPN